ncbi:hypothetical protein WMF38_00355 [Sorangium sp. So ce118]
MRFAGCPARGASVASVLAAAQEIITMRTRELYRPIVLASVLAASATGGCSGATDTGADGPEAQMLAETHGQPLDPSCVIASRAPGEDPNYGDADPSTASYCCEAEQPGCRQGVTLYDDKKLAVYSTTPIRGTEPNLAIKHAVVVLHGQPGNADVAFAAVAGAMGSSTDTVVVAPFLGGTEGAKRSKAQLNIDGAVDWGDKVKNWAGGDLGFGGAPAISSFAALDLLATRLVAAFPDLESLTFAGFSAGGQAIQRYAAMSRGGLPGCSPVDVRFFVASPTSYLYLSDQRLNRTARCPDEDGRCDVQDDFVDGSERDSACDDYNTYRYGLDDVPSHLKTMSRAIASTYQETYLGNKISYLVNTGDQGGSPDCEDKMQGPRTQSFRMQRGLVFYNHLLSTAQEENLLVRIGNHRMYIYDGAPDDCHHDEYCVYASSIARELLSSDGQVTCTDALFEPHREYEVLKP